MQLIDIYLDPAKAFAAEKEKQIGRASCRERV